MLFDSQVSLATSEKKDDFIRCSLLAFCFTADDGFRRIQDTTYTRDDCSAIYGTSCWLIGWRSRDPDKIPSFHCLSLDRITDWMAQPFYINR